MKPEAVWQIELGKSLSGADVANAMARHGELMQRMHVFQEKYEFLLCAVNQVPPFDATITLAARDRRREDGKLSLLDEICVLDQRDFLSCDFRPRRIYLR